MNGPAAASSGAEFKSAEPGEAPATLELRGVSKRFPGVRALDKISFTVSAGQIHMLLGENGAGKSTLMKILCGAVRADAGEIFFEGRKVEIRSAQDSAGLGIAVIFQEFSLVPHLDVAQNIYLGRAAKLRGLPGFINRRQIYEDAGRLLDRLGFDLDPRASVHALGVARQQMVEIAKALSRDARVLVLDEPTSALSDREAERLFAILRQLRDKGVAIVYISHRLPEVFALGDRITVLRDGRNVGSVAPEDTNPDDLVRLMVGRSVDLTYRRHLRSQLGEVVLEARGLSAANGVRNIELVVRAGEIVGLCGLVGSGRTEVARALFGADPLLAGEVRVLGRAKTGGPEVSSRLGLALIPESRKNEGLALTRSVAENIVLAGLPSFCPRGYYSPGRMRGVAADIIGRLRIATPSPEQTVGVLSGGNQQKVVIGKWLAAGARIFIFDEPTRGIDVGAKAEIFALMDELVAKGAAALMISSEQSEIVRVCDRAYVMRDSRIVGELSRDELTEEGIVRMGMHHA
jgi:ribose transport system ATP-binding protein